MITLVVFYVNNVMFLFILNRVNLYIISVKIILTNTSIPAILAYMKKESQLFDTTILRKAGLTESQAKGYLALIEYGTLSPVELAEKTGESRTNGYMICEKLENLGLVSKKEGKKALYTPAHPSALEVLAEKRRKILVRNEQDVKGGLSPLIDMFYRLREEPGARTLQGIEGIKSVYADTLRTPDKKIYLLRTTADSASISLGEDFFDNYRQERANIGIDTYAITPMNEVSYKHLLSGEDTHLRYHRTPLPDNTYTAPVEIDVYGDKVALIAFGDTQMATIITSPPIAEAMRQVLHMIITTYKTEKPIKP